MRDRAREEIAEAKDQEIEADLLATRYCHLVWIDKMWYPVESPDIWEFLKGRDYIQAYNVYRDNLCYGFVDKMTAILFKLKIT